MRALTLRQPFGFFTFSEVWVDGPDGLKSVASRRVENRPMRPPASIAPHDGAPGELFAITTSQKLDRASIAEARIRGYVLPDDWPLAADTAPERRTATSTGAVIGVARIERVVEQKRWTVDIPGDQLRWWVGPYGWVLCDVAALPVPVPCKGQLPYGWRLPEDVEEMVVTQLQRDGREMPG
jgi:hypothetical protein